MHLAKSGLSVSARFRYDEWVLHAVSVLTRVVIATTFLLGGLGFVADAQAPATMQSLIHPGDQLNVQVYGDQSLTQNVTVLQDGTLDYPLVGRISVAGKTPPQAAGLIAQRLGRYVRKPIVTISVVQLAQPSVLVLGDVKNPGKYQLRSDGRISDAIAAAGGVLDLDGDYPDARISEPGGTPEKVSLQRLFRGGETGLDQELAEGTVVYVPGPVQFNISVLGAVDHPGTVVVNEGDRVSIAIAKAGSSANAMSDLNNIKLIRTGANGARVTSEVNLYAALHDGNESADPALQKGDELYVPQNTHKPLDFFSGILYFLGNLIKI
jgi:polysaccharide export outer membrane protein